MTSQTDHLNESAKAALALSDQERINFIRRPRWIGYTKAKQIIAQLENLLTHPKIHRMPNLLLVGETNNGKTMIVNRFHQLHPATDDPNTERFQLPVLVVQAPPVPSETRFYNAILEKLSAPYRASDRVDKKQFQVLKILSRVRIQMMIIDEIHQIVAGKTGKQRQFLNTIKYLGNELQIPIVGVGTYEAFNALQTDPQLANRFEPTVLPRWEQGQEYLRLLSSFERMLPLKRPTHLAEKDLAFKLLVMSEGTIGELSALLARAAMSAIEKKTETITPKLLDGLGWVRPSERKWRAEKNV
ncbi:MAG: TniB family NTP-binding protein [Acidobacteria bacterium]|nr:TniB family NTP-binding protein [Acidobacteriota bacterium]